MFKKKMIGTELARGKIGNLLEEFSFKSRGALNSGSDGKIGKCGTRILPKPHQNYN